MRDMSGPAFPSKRVSHWQAKPGPTINSPSTAAEAVYEYHGGMSLRDYFAAQALAAIISKIPLKAQVDTLGTGAELTDSDTAAEIYSATVRGAYKYADAMLKEREK